MTSPDVKIDQASAAESAAALRALGAKVATAADGSIAAMNAASAAPLPAGTVPGPEVSVIAAAMASVSTDLHSAATGLTSAAADLEAWAETEVGAIDQPAAAVVHGVGTPTAAPEQTGGGGQSW